MSKLSYIQHYSTNIQDQVQKLIDSKKLGEYLLSKYPKQHLVKNNKNLYNYTQNLKKEFFKNAYPISKVEFDSKIDVINNALGMHTFISRVQGKKLKSKNEIRISTLFKNSSEEFLKMIVVHELAHLKHKEHNKAFYQLCHHMEENYSQYEFDLRLLLIHKNIFGNIY